MVLNGLLSLTYRFAAGCGIPLDINVDVWPGTENGLEFRVRYETRRPDGRLRVLLPLGFTAESFVVDSHFRVSQTLTAVSGSVISTAAVRLRTVSKAARTKAASMFRAPCGWRGACCSALKRNCCHQIRPKDTVAISRE